MKASLISRDVIADSVELVMHAERLDGLVGIAGCDKSEPGMLMAMARLNLPSVYLYGGTILAGTYGGRDITIQDVFEAVGAHAKGSIDDAELLAIERASVPDHRLLRRHVHGEHDGRSRGGARYVVAGQREPAGRRLPPRGVRAGVGPRADEAARVRSPAQGHPDPGRLHERDRRRDGAGRLHERGAAPARDRARGGVRLELDDFDRISRAVPHLVDVRRRGNS